VTGVDGATATLTGDVCLGVSDGCIGSASLGGAVIGDCEGATEALVARVWGLVGAGVTGGSLTGVLGCLVTGLMDAVVGEAVDCTLTCDISDGIFSGSKSSFRVPAGITTLAGVGENLKGVEGEALTGVAGEALNGAREAGEGLAKKEGLCVVGTGLTVVDATAGPALLLSLI